MSKIVKTGITTWSDLEELLNHRGANLAYLALGHIMDDIEDETGHWPNWDDPVPEDVLRMFYPI